MFYIPQLLLGTKTKPRIVSFTALSEGQAFITGSYTTIGDYTQRKTVATFKCGIPVTDTTTISTVDCTDTWLATLWHECYICQICGWKI